MLAGWMDDDWSRCCGSTLDTLSQEKVPGKSTQVRGSEQWDTLAHTGHTLQAMSSNSTDLAGEAGQTVDTGMGLCSSDMTVGVPRRTRTHVLVVDAPTTTPPLAWTNQAAGKLEGVCDMSC